MSLLLEEPRATPDLDEVAVIFMQPQDRPMHVVKLIEDLRSSHFNMTATRALHHPYMNSNCLRKQYLAEMTGGG
jgi:hypothetical protein